MTRPSLTRDQRRAQHALQQIKDIRARIDADGGDEKVVAKVKKFGAEYKSYVERLPASIVMNGLGQACAMLLAQAKGETGAKDAHRLLYDHLENWLCRTEYAVYPKDQTLIEAVIQHGQRDYVRAQAESLAYLDWLKKFAQAYLAGEESRNGEAE